MVAAAVALFVSSRRRCVSVAPLILQSDQSDCGLAALAMIAACHGHNLRLEEIKTRYSNLDAGPTLKTVLSVAEALDLVPRPLRLELRELSALKLPAILHWQFDHFVVLVKATRGRCLIHDPAAGRRWASLNEIDESFTGVAVEFTRGDTFAAQQGKRLSAIRELLRHCSGLGRYFGLMLATLLATQLLALAPPVATQLLIDQAVAGQDRRWLLGILAGTGVILLTSILLDVVRRRITLFVSTRFAIDTSAAVIAALFSMPALSIRKRSVGDVVARIDSLAPLRKALTETALDGIVQLVIVLTTLALMLLYSVSLTVVSLVAMSLAGLLYFLVLPSARSRNLEAIVHSASATNSLIESLRGFESLESMGLRTQRLAHWQRSFSLAMNAQARRTSLMITASAGNAIVAALDQLLFLGLGVAYVSSGTVTLGVLFALFALRGRLGGATARLVFVAQELYMLRTHADRLAELLGGSRPPAAPASAVSSGLGGRISCSDVGFSWPGGRRLICGLSCDIGPGERVVISGPSGAGKTTLMKLLSLSLTPTRGSIAYDGLEADLWDRRALRQQFGVVLQDDRLFQGSLLDNISAFDPVPDLHKAKRSAELAAIWSDICAMPMGVHTLVDIAGLSGGQVQRVLLARALYRDPAILFLDEATAHLDRVTERRVLGNLRNLDMTIISIAHSEQALSLGGRCIKLAVNTSPEVSLEKTADYQRPPHQRRGGD